MRELCPPRRGFEHGIGRCGLRGGAGRGTDVSVAYTLTPLNAEAAADVEEFLAPLRYQRMMDEWQAATGAALARGA